MWGLRGLRMLIVENVEGGNSSHEVTTLNPQHSQPSTFSTH